MKGFTVNNGQGGKLNVNAVHEIAPSRCKRTGTRCAVVIGIVTDGVFMSGDKIVIKNKAGEEVLSDFIGRLEVSCREIFEVPKGSRVGMLIMNHGSEDLLGLGIPRHQTHTRPDAHPYRS